MQNRPATGKFQPSLLFVIMMLGFLLIMRDWSKYQDSIETIPYSQFLNYVSSGKVSDIILGQTRITGTLKNPEKNQKKEFSTIRVEDPNLIQKLSDSKVGFSGIHENTFFRGLLAWIFPFFIFYLLWSFILRRGGGMGHGTGFLSLGKSKAKVYVETHLKTRFDDVAGVDEAKEELSEIVNFLKEPERYSILGGRMPKGILLVGPPGTGKTLLSRAVAGEANVPFFSINGSEFVELFVGLGAARVRDLFEQARLKAPCIVFIDELDALGKARGLSAITGSSNDEKEQTLNQLLAEMDGFDPTTGIIVLAATNRPEVLDPALLRAGRYDRQILVDKPDRLGREKILRIHLKKIKLGKEVNVNAVAAMTAGFSGADLANLANEAALIATRRKAALVESEDFTAAIERIVAGLERKNRILNSDERRRVAYHEMGHATVAIALGKEEIVHKVSIIPRGIGSLGYTMRRPTEDRYLMAKRELESKIAIALGGRASEMIFFDDISTGAGDDLDKATEIARAMVTQYGMDYQLGLVVFEREPTPMLGSQVPVRTFEYGEKTTNLIDDAVHRILNEALRTSLDIIRSQRSFIEGAVQVLLERETLDETQLKDLWQRHQRRPLQGLVNL